MTRMGGERTGKSLLQVKQISVTVQKANYHAPRTPTRTTHTLVNYCRTVSGIPEVASLRLAVPKLRDAT